MPRTLAPEALICCSRLEKTARRRGFQIIAGTDEAGRGAMAGPLYVAAVILDRRRPIRGADDSKKLQPEERQRLSIEIRKKAVAFQVVAIPAWEVDALNVYEASRVGMIRALSALMPEPEFILTDAMRLHRDGYGPGFRTPHWAIIHGDARSVSIAAASILAKVARDAHLAELDAQYPGYNLAQNKGYCTREHIEALARLGPSPEHRRTYQPVRDILFPSLPFGPV